MITTVTRAPPHYWVEMAEKSEIASKRVEFRVECRVRQLPVPAGCFGTHEERSMTMNCRRVPAFAASASALAMYRWNMSRIVCAGQGDPLGFDHKPPPARLNQ